MTPPVLLLPELPDVKKIDCKIGLTANRNCVRLQVLAVIVMMGQPLISAGATPGGQVTIEVIGTMKGASVKLEKGVCHDGATAIRIRSNT